MDAIKWFSLERVEELEQAVATIVTAGGLIERRNALAVVDELVSFDFRAPGRHSGQQWSGLLLPCWCWHRNRGDWSPRP